eukprot:GEMP01000840.1.p1 GENE.GEMP01000840.1~~GEMP01000840.1.p1  ORF type:complete len:1749 (+),score=428.08 GEMP01000840.1:227-5473(+)
MGNAPAREDFGTVFGTYDVDGSNTLSFEEFGGLVRAYADLKEDTVRYFFDELRTGHDEIEFDSFVGAPLDIIQEISRSTRPPRRRQSPQARPEIATEPKIRQDTVPLETSPNNPHRSNPFSAKHGNSSDGSNRVKEHNSEDAIMERIPRRRRRRPPPSPDIAPRVIPDTPPVELSDETPNDDARRPQRRKRPEAALPAIHAVHAVGVTVVDVYIRSAWHADTPTSKSVMCEVYTVVGKVEHYPVRDDLIYHGAEKTATARTRGRDTIFRHKISGLPTRDGTDRVLVVVLAIGAMWNAPVGAVELTPPFPAGVLPYKVLPLAGTTNDGDVDDVTLYVAIGPPEDIADIEQGAAIFGASALAAHVNLCAHVLRVEHVPQLSTIGSTNPFVELYVATGFSDYPIPDHEFVDGPFATQALRGSDNPWFQETFTIRLPTVCKLLVVIVDLGALGTRTPLCFALIDDPGEGLEKYPLLPLTTKIEGAPEVSPEASISLVFGSPQEVADVVDGMGGLGAHTIAQAAEYDILLQRIEHVPVTDLLSSDPFVEIYIVTEFTLYPPPGPTILAGPLTSEVKNSELNPWYTQVFTVKIPATASVLVVLLDADMLWNKMVGYALVAPPFPSGMQRLGLNPMPGENLGKFDLSATILSLAIALRTPSSDIVATAVVDDAKVDDANGLEVYLQNANHLPTDGILRSLPSASVSIYAVTALTQFPPRAVDLIYGPISTPTEMPATSPRFCQTCRIPGIPPHIDDRAFLAVIVHNKADALGYVAIHRPFCSPLQTYPLIALPHRGGVHDLLRATLSLAVGPAGTLGDYQGMKGKILATHIRQRVDLQVYISSASKLSDAGALVVEVYVVKDFPGYPLKEDAIAYGPFQTNETKDSERWDHMFDIPFPETAKLLFVVINKGMLGDTPLGHVLLSAPFLPGLCKYKLLTLPSLGIENTPPPPNAALTLAVGAPETLWPLIGAQQEMSGQDFALLSKCHVYVLGIFNMPHQCTVRVELYVVRAFDSIYPPMASAEQQVMYGPFSTTVYSSDAESRHAMVEESFAIFSHPRLSLLCVVLEMRHTTIGQQQATPMGFVAIDAPLPERFMSHQLLPFPASDDVNLAGCAVVVGIGQDLSALIKAKLHQRGCGRDPISTVQPLQVHIVRAEGVPDTAFALGGSVATMPFVAVRLVSFAGATSSGDEWMSWAGPVMSSVSTTPNLAPVWSERLDLGVPHLAPRALCLSPLVVHLALGYCTVPLESTRDAVHSLRLRPMDNTRTTYDLTNCKIVVGFNNVAWPLTLLLLRATNMSSGEVSSSGAFVCVKVVNPRTHMVIAEKRSSTVDDRLAPVWKERLALSIVIADPLTTPENLHCVIELWRANTLLSDVLLGVYRIQLDRVLGRRGQDTLPLVTSDKSTISLWVAWGAVDGRAAEKITDQVIRVHVTDVLVTGKTVRVGLRGEFVGDNTTVAPPDVVHCSTPYLQIGAGWVVFNETLEIKCPAKNGIPLVSIAVEEKKDDGDWKPLAVQYFSLREIRDFIRSKARQRHILPPVDVSLDANIPLFASWTDETIAVAWPRRTATCGPFSNYREASRLTQTSPRFELRTYTRKGLVTWNGRLMSSEMCATSAGRVCLAWCRLQGRTLQQRLGGNATARGWRTDGSGPGRTRRTALIVKWCITCLEYDVKEKNLSRSDIYFLALPRISARRKREDEWLGRETGWGSKERKEREEQEQGEGERGWLEVFSSFTHFCSIRIIKDWPAVEFCYIRLHT